MRVLHVIWNLGQGGSQRYLLDLLHEIAPSTRCDVLVLSKPGPLSKDVENLCGSVNYLNMHGGMNILFMSKILNYLRKSSAELIHSHSNNVILNMCFYLQKKPVVYTEHGGRLLGRSMATHILYKYLGRPVKRFIAISEYMSKVMVNENPGISPRVVVIHNGVGIGRISAVQCIDSLSRHDFGLPQGRLVGFVGRLVQQKGIDYFIDIAKNVTDKIEDVSFVVVGDGPLLAKMRAHVDDLGISSKVHFLGYQKDVIPLIKTFDVIVSTSRCEAFGLVIAEAMAASVPLVAMDNLGAVSEIVRDGIDGIVVKGPDVEQAAAAVMGLLNDKEYANKLAASAHQRVHDLFTMEMNAKQVQREYALVLEEARQE